MAMNVVRPISLISSGRPQEMGKIKTGKLTSTANGRTRPTTIETFRFVSRDEEAVRTLAAVFGGTVNAVDGQFDLESEARQIDVMLPPDPLGGTPIYELWSGGGCQRRCDGEMAVVPVRTGDDVSFEDVRCVCASNNEMECKPTVRLSVILPQVHLGGVWNLKTNSWAAAREMQQMVTLIEAAQTRGLTSATLGIEKREQTVAGKKKKFSVPVLKLSATLADLMAGTTPAPAIAAPSFAEIGPGDLHFSEQQRADLNAAWAIAADGARDDATKYMESVGRSGDALLASDYLPLMDKLRGIIDGEPW